VSQIDQIIGLMVLDPVENCLNKRLMCAEELKLFKPVQTFRSLYEKWSSRLILKAVLLFDLI